MDISRTKMMRRVPLIGQLMVAAGILEEHALNQALEIAKRSDQRIGRVLVMTGAIKDPEVACCLLAQKMIKEGVLTVEVAKTALSRACKTGRPLEAVLEELGWQLPVVTTDEIGQILASSGFITKDLYTQAAKDSREASQLMGRYLVLKGAITSSALMAVVDALELVQLGVISRDQAVQALAHMRINRLSLDDALLTLGFVVPIGPRIKIWHLLTQSGMITDSEYIEVAEKAVTDNKTTAVALVESGLVNVKSLETAMRLEGLVSTLMLSKEDALDVMRQMHRSGSAQDFAIDRLCAVRRNSPTAKLAITLLIQSGALHDSFSEHSLQTSVPVGGVEPPLSGSAMQCAHLVETGVLKVEHAVIALQYCHRTRGSLEDAFRELNMLDMLSPPSNKMQEATHQFKKPLFINEPALQPEVSTHIQPRNNNKLVVTASLGGLAILSSIGTVVVPPFLPEGLAHDGTLYSLLAVSAALVFLALRQWRSKTNEPPVEEEHMRMRIRGGQTRL